MMRAIELAAGWAWETSVAALPLVALALAGMLALRKAVFTPIRHMLGLLVVARLLMPFAPSSPFSVLNWVRSPERMVWAEVQPSLAGLEVIESKGPGVETPGYSRGVPVGTSWNAKAAGSKLSVLSVVWAMGVVIILGRVFWQHLNVRSWIKHAAAITSGPGFEALSEAKKLSGISRSITLLAVKEISSPALFGIWRPAILLPPALLEGNAERLRLVLLHEIAHIKRWDVLIKWLMILARASHWFNPLVWLAMRRLTAEQELLCDGDVLRLIGEERQRDYAETLLALASRASTTPPTVISISSNFKQMKERIGMIRQFKPATHRLLLFAVPPLAAIIAIVTFTAATKKPAAKPPVDVPASATETAKQTQSQERQRADERIKALRTEHDRLRAQINDRKNELESLRKELKILPGIDNENVRAPEMIRDIERERLTAEGELVRLDTLYENLKSMNRTQLRQSIPTAYKDEALDRLLADFSKVEQQLILLKKDYAEEHPEVARQQALLKHIDQRIEQRLDGIISGLGTLVSARKAVLKAVQGSLEREKDFQNEIIGRYVPYFDRKRELESMQKMCDALYLQLLEAEVNSRMPAR
jgi:beta-lactamase regulating signal transducer with metallopeptidase domain